ncbi:hypothetical protein ACOMHN_044705 [Nucella lapillus]
MPLSVFGTSSAIGSNLRETLLTRLPLGDVLFTEDVLREVSAWSQVDCSKKCAETEGCVMCTFHSSPQGPPGHCRLHSQRKTAADGKKIASGASSFALPASPSPKCTTTPATCDEGYFANCGMCLLSLEDELTNTAAQNYCGQLDGAQLVMPKTLADLMCVKSFMILKGQYHSWVGANDTSSAGSFHWADGTPLPDSSSLWESRPSGSTSLAQCGFLDQNSQSKLMSINCDSTYRFVCQRACL